MSLNPFNVDNVLREEYDERRHSAAGEAWFWTTATLYAISCIALLCMALAFIGAFIYFLGYFVYLSRYLIYFLLAIFASFYLAFKVKLIIKKFRADRSVAQ